MIAVVRLHPGAVGANRAHASAEVEEERPIVGMQAESDDHAAGVCLAALDQLKLELVVDVLDARCSRFCFSALQNITSMAAVGTHRG